MDSATVIAIKLDQNTVTRIAAETVRQLLDAQQMDGEREGYLRPEAAARYLGLSRKRVYDLTSMGAIVPDGRDGRTPLFLRSTLDRYVRGESD